MLDAITDGKLTPAQAKAWLTSVVRSELDRIERQRMISRMDPVGSSEEGQRLDWATARAWRSWRSYAMGWCNEASNRYGLVTVKYVHAYCLFRLHLPWAFETPEPEHSAQIEAVLAGPGDESKRMKGLADRLKEMTTIREHNA
ncbi:hypothetical protein JMK10_15520 [Rhodovulum sulfidophilum]|nr:hypothetical protein [Rhodovulum sulfidophilum]MBL3574509.1 hypothetical protein [Rhodovulum sulfidophilum]MCE8432083.1 hypothetical protein [Rhodovulum sulfidophilum]MCF4118184.1 hypothetical protein [Rhodovulum sulfidophilum]